MMCVVLCLKLSYAALMFLHSWRALMLWQEVVLSSEQDPFFKSNMYENFGDLGANIKRMVDEFQQNAKSNQNIQSLGIVG